MPRMGREDDRMRKTSDEATETQGEMSSGQNRSVYISDWAGQCDAKRKKERTTLEQSSQQQEKQISFSGCCWETAPKDPHTINQHSQCCSYLHYLPVSSMNAAEMTGVQRSDLITRSGGGLKLLYHISILTPQTSSGRPLWDKTRDKTRPVRPRIQNLSLIDSKMS